MERKAHKVLLCDKTSYIGWLAGYAYCLHTLAGWMVYVCSLRTLVGWLGTSVRVVAWVASSLAVVLAGARP